ncbi:hypothetical protein JCM5296_005120 [Sporobolomyces johnsonii]
MLTQLEQLRSQNRQLEEDVKTRDEQSAGLQADVDVSLQYITHDLNGQIADALKDPQAQKDIKALRAENAKLRQRADDLSKERHDLKSTVRELKDNLVVARESGQEVIKQLGDDVATKDRKIMRFKARIDDLADEGQAVKDEAKKKVEKAKRKVDRLKTCIDNLEDETQAAKYETQAAKVEAQSVKDEARNIGSFGLLNAHLSKLEWLLRGV